MPPTRRSISTLSTGPRSPPHHRFTYSGVVHARYTCSLGAAKTRSIRIWSSAGSVTTAECLLVVAAISFLLRSKFVQYPVQAVESLGPGSFVGPHPVVDRLEGPGVQPVDPLPALLARFHESNFSQHTQVLGDHRLRR